MDIFHPNNNNNSFIFDKRNMIIQTTPSSYTSPKNTCNNIVDTIENFISSNTIIHNNNNEGICTNRTTSAFVRPFFSNFSYYYQQTSNNDDTAEVIPDEDDQQKLESIPPYDQLPTPISDINSYVETDGSNGIQISTGFPKMKKYNNNGSLKSIKYYNNKSGIRHVPHKNKPPQIVERRNERERRRVEAVNSAYLRLRKAVPIDNTRGKRISKVKTLQKAIEYIDALQNLLKENEAYFPIQFKGSQYVFNLEY